MIIWGNHSSTQFPDVRFATVDGAAIKTADDAYYQGDFIKTVQTRGAAVIKARGQSSAMSAAKAVLDHMRDWFQGSHGEIVSMAIIPPVGVYGLSTDLCFSLPVKCIGGFNYEIVQGLELNEFAQRLFDATRDELIEEKTTGGLA